MKNMLLLLILSCPECGAFHLVYWGHKVEEEDKQHGIEGYEDGREENEVILDIETDGFNPSKIHCIVVKI